MDAKEWNAQFPPGTHVHVTLDDGSEVSTRTRSEAWRLNADASVVLVQSHSGGYLLDRVRPCGECGLENWAPAVSGGVCAWCGYDVNAKPVEVRDDE